MTAVLLLALAATPDVVRLFPGYLTRIQCEGRLLVSAVGNEGVVRLEALPKELGCGVLVKPLVGAGRTNLILETSSGTIERIIEVVPNIRPEKGELRTRLKAVTL